MIVHVTESLQHQLHWNLTAVTERVYVNSSQRQHNLNTSTITSMPIVIISVLRHVVHTHA